MTAEEPDYHLRDLYNAIEAGDAPEWQLRDADHALRRRARLPVQPVRPDEDLVARGTTRRSRSGAWCSTATRRTTSPRSSRPPSSRRTWSRASGPRRTRCCSGSCSPTRTRTATGSAPTICSSRSTRPRARCTPTTRTGTCATSTAVRPRSTRRTRTAGRRPTLRKEIPGWGVEGGEMIREAYSLRSGGRRLRAAGHAGPRSHVGDRPREPGGQHRRPPLAGRHAGDAAARARLLEQGRREPRLGDRRPARREQRPRGQQRRARRVGRGQPVGRPQATNAPR